MKIKSTAASLLVLALFASPVLADSHEQTPPPDPAVDVAAPAVPEDVLALINDRRAASELSDDDLKNRARAARKASRNKELTQDIREQLQAVAEADMAELQARNAAAEKPKAEEAPKTEEVPKAEEPVKAEEQPPEQPVEQKAEEPAAQPDNPPPKPAIPSEVSDLVNDSREVSALTPEELQARAQLARRFAQDENLPKTLRRQLSQMARAARQELQAREQAKAKPVEEQPAEQPAAEQPAEEKPADPPKQEAEQPATPTPPAEKQQVQQLDGNAGKPEAEAAAKAFLENPTPAEQLNDEALRQRLDAMRDLIQQNALSLKTERQLRKKLRDDRLVLRARIAKVKADEDAKAVAAAAAAEEKKKQEQAAAEGKKPEVVQGEIKKPNILITPETPRRRILADRRPSDELDESELRIRIQVYLDFERDDSYDDYDDDQRDYWRRTIRSDRERLRNRMVEDRNIRRVEYEQKKSNIRRIEIDDEEFDNSDRYEDDVFAAEVDDEDIERVIVAPPKKKVRRVARVEELADKPEVRNSLRRIEIDTIRFGFNEAFVREEEINNLDEIALVIERVLKKYPREVFLIEGHTDAVGSDAYNINLSKARAEAVKKALTSFYIIPGKNLKTVGLGERYLKIPTADQEPENRRVSLSRATSVVGESDE